MLAEGFRAFAQARGDATNPGKLTLIIDEAHLAKNPDAKRTKSIAPIVLDAEIVYGLTGTPMPNHVEDLWNVFRVCGLGGLLGPRSRFGATFLSVGAGIEEACRRSPRDRKDHGGDDASAHGSRCLC